MNALKPCLIYRHLSRWFAWDEHGRLITWRYTWSEVDTLVRSLGYEPQSPNGRWSAALRDRMRQRYPSLVQQS